MIKLEFTRPIIKTGNWEQLDIIKDKKITTEIIVMAKPEFKLREGNYQFGNIKVDFKVGNNNIIIEVERKIKEEEYNLNKIPGKKPMPQKIPNFVKDCINEILRQNNRPIKSFLKDTNWVEIIINYKLRDKKICTAIYPKIKGPKGMKFDGSVFSI